MAKGKRTKKKQQKKMNIDVAVIITIIASILLMVLIYTKAGFLGEHLSPMLGGIIGWIKYILPIGTFLIAIYLACERKEYISSKLIQYAVFLLCVTTIMNVYQISNNTIDINNGLSKAVQDSYILGTQDIGGGAVGALIAYPLVSLLGQFGTIILCIGIAIVLLVFIFRIHVTEKISQVMDGIEDRKEQRTEQRELRIKEKAQLNTEQIKMSKKGKIDIPLDDDVPNVENEGKWGRKNKKKANSIDIPLDDDDEININLNRKTYNHEEDNLFNAIPENKIEVPQVQPQEKVEENIQNDLFKQEEEKKEEKVKEVLNLEHTVTVEDENYEFPPIQLLSENESKEPKFGRKAVAETANRLQKTLYSFGVSAKVENVSVGPAITRYELKPAEGVRVSKIAKLSDDIALNLAAESIRIEAPIPGKQAVGIEVPNKEKEMVHLREIIDSDSFKNHKSKMAFALGKDVAGEEIVTDIAKMPHVLIAGSTGSGKSVCINTLITSIIYKAKPSEVKLVMVDPKVVELSVYNGIPHLLIPVVTDPKKAAGALSWAVQEMVKRYGLFAEKGVRDLKGYNEALEKENGAKLPQIVIIIDELADLMMVAPNDVEDAICRLAQMARAAGMHLVIATQRPSVDVITGIIKANIPSRIAFAVSSQVDSRTILDMTGAEKLLGKGDMLFYPTGVPKPTRIQGAFISDKEVESIVEFLKSNGEVTYSEDILDSIENAGNTDKDIKETDEEDDTDPFLMEAIDTVVETGQASTSFIQRRFKVGYARAGRIIDQMEQRGVISGYEGSKPRQVLMSKERWAELKTAPTQQVPQQTQEETTESNTQ